MNKGEVPEFTEREKEFVDPSISCAEKILKFTGLSWDDLRDKKVLDLGGGDASLAHEAQQHGIDTVITLDKFAKPEYIKEKRGFVQADYTQTLPFGDATIDLVVSSHALTARESNNPTVQEIHRILKDGGKLIIWPALIGYPERPAQEEMEMMKTIEQELKERAGLLYDVNLRFTGDTQKEHFYGDYLFELMKRAKE